VQSTFAPTGVVPPVTSAIHVKHHILEHIMEHVAELGRCMNTWQFMVQNRPQDFDPDLGTMLKTFQAGEVGY
jgi:hypothetical protein